MIYKVVLFVAFNIPILLASWKSFHGERVHGFYRFFVFESILLEFLLNMNYWFDNPFSAVQLISWFFLIVSLFLVYGSVSLLKTVGKPKEIAEGSANLGFENTTKLVTEGLYKYIRHPMYTSLLLLGWGIFFKHISPISLLLAISVTVFLVLTAKIEEGENIKTFGEDYKEYMKKSGRFIPFVPLRSEYPDR